MNQENYPPAPPTYDQSTGAPPMGAPAYGAPPMGAPAYGAPMGANPNAPQYAPQNVQHPQIVHVQLGPQSCQLTCSNCHSLVNTNIMSETGRKAWIIAAALCFFGCWCCVCLPCCMDGMQDVTHTCPNCNAFIGKYKA